MMGYCKLEVYVPATHAGALKEALAAGRGREARELRLLHLGVRRNRAVPPLAGSRPFLGTEGAVETVAETKLEMIVERPLLDAVLKALRAAHPYETPAFQYWPVQL